MSSLHQTFYNLDPNEEVLRDIRNALISVLNQVQDDTIFTSTMYTGKLAMWLPVVAPNNQLTGLKTHILTSLPAIDPWNKLAAIMALQQQIMALNVIMTINNINNLFVPLVPVPNVPPPVVPPPVPPPPAIGYQAAYNESPDAEEFAKFKGAYQALSGGNYEHQHDFMSARAQRLTEAGCDGAKMVPLKDAVLADTPSAPWTSGTFGPMILMIMSKLNMVTV